MIISFFEEFPTKENLNKLKNINYPTKLYLAASSLKEFEKLRIKVEKIISHKFIKDIIYWPILEKKEGYWISPFTKRKALLRILNELNAKQKKNQVSVMLDLELPTTKKPSLYLTQFFNFYRNKKLIRNFIKNYLGDIYLAEYYPEGKFKEKIMTFFGIHYKNKKVKIIKMFYHSMHHFKESFVENEFKKGVKDFGKNYVVALGTIALGINGNEPILRLSQLEKDLELAKKTKVKEVIIFRLGGLNKNYNKILIKYSK